jgi:8-oxo-dGTP pyrophosphatase MutT (NUDIX family)
VADWKTLSTKVAYDNPWMFVREDKAINPGGKEVIYGVVESKSDSVYVVPVDDEGNTYIVLQYRYTLQRNEWECVAGRNDGEAPLIAAERELLEETGLEATNITIFGDIQASTGISTFHGTFCLARGITKVTEQLDETDGILEVKKVPLTEVPAMILRGEIKCSQSIAALFMAIAYLKDEAQTANS